MSGELTITTRWVGANGIACLTAKIGEIVIACNKVDTAKESSRREFAASLAAGHPGIDAGAIEAQLLRLAASRAEQCDPPQREDRSVAATLVAMVKERAELFHDSEPKAYATVRVNGHRETWPVRSSKFRLWLRKLVQTELDISASPDAIRQALEDIESLATFSGEERGVHVRVAAGEDGALYVDLADDMWRAARITAEGWQITDDPPVRFIRPRGLLPLPVPARGGSLNDLRHLVNVRTDRDFVLIVAWLLAAYRPLGPFPVLNVTGEQGSAKSTLQKMIRRLIDPNIAPLRADPRDTRDVVIAASNARVVALDNLSHLSPWLSDCLCRLSTGGGFATRELYTDAEETIFDVQRPVMLNGIETVVTRSDLLDRSLTITLDPVPDDKRMSERELWARFDKVAPGIIGALLDAAAAGLRNFENVSLGRLPRMADFATWIVACEPALPWPTGIFLDAYAGSREDANASAIEHSLIGPPLLAFLAEREQWEGTATELLRELERQRGDKAAKRKGWPADGARLSGQLHRIAPNLRAEGITVEFRRYGHNRTKILTISKVCNSASAPSAYLQDAVETADGCGRSTLPEDARPPDAADLASTSVPTFWPENADAGAADGDLQASGGWAEEGEL